jgi:hypothetical protein
MPDNHELRIHIEYELLYLAELRAILRDFERAYNLLEDVDRGPWSRISHSDRLIVRTLETGNSLTLTFLGGVMLLKLGQITKELADARLTFHKSEEAKWKAKSARLDYEEKESQSRIGGRKAPEMLERHQERDDAAPAINIIEHRLEIIERNDRITALEIGIDGNNVKIIAKASGQKRINK